ncbi:efflux RND transporter periplasmic adaptor subunit [Pseudorhodobacter antarcticus]|nr:efflux RND transporter periplasmic adaptor subunit [Pseudorhodobacter antarcticus]
MASDKKDVADKLDPVPKDAAKTAVPPQVPALRPVVSATKAPVPRQRCWLWFGAGILAVGLSVAGYFQPWVTQPLVVAVEVATLAPVTRILAVNGRIASAQSVAVRPLVSGRLDALLVAEGDVVTAGQVLAQINAQAANASMRQAVAGLDAALVAQVGAVETYARSVALGRNIARSVLDAQARAVQSAGQEVARTTALVDQARIALENYTLRAPIAGDVLLLAVDPGQSVDPSLVLMTLADLTDLLVETDVDEGYATQISRGQLAVLQLAGEGEARPGRVGFVSSRVDVATGGLALKLMFDEGVEAPIGLTVTANIVVDQQDAALTLPRTALVTKDAEEGVFLVKDGTARFQPVEVVDWPAARLIVTKGLAVGDAMIVDGTGIEAGQAVRVMVP